MLFVGEIVEGSIQQMFVIAPGILTMLCILTAGVMSVIALTKYKDHAILLFVPALIGAFGLLFVIGEFIFPH